MTITELIGIVSNRLISLAQAKAHAATIGDLDRVASIDADINETESTLSQLRSLE